MYVCVFGAGKLFFFLVEEENQTAHSDSTVFEELLSVLLDAHSVTVLKRRVVKRHVYRRPVKLCTAFHMDGISHSDTHTAMERALVLNNDMQLPRMSMSLPVFVRSYLVLLWKPNVILKNPLCVAPCAEKSQSIRESQASSPTLAAAVRLSAMIHGKDQVYAKAMLVDQVREVEILILSLTRIYSV